MPAGDPMMLSFAPRDRSLAAWSGYDRAADGGARRRWSLDRGRCPSL